LFNRVFELPLLRNAQKRDKKTEQNNRGREKKNGGGKSRIFCDEPRWIFLNFFFRVFELPLLRNAQKTPLKKSIKNKNKNKMK
jgi:hypothetical protein